VTEHGADFDLFGFKVDHGKVSAAIPLALEQYGQYVRQSCDGSAVTPQAPCDLQQSMVASCI
jgi:hypothetical protein